MSALIRILSLLVVWCVPAVSWGAGFYLPGRGLQSMGRAGASVAGGDTLQTIWYNPANLVEMSGFHALVDVGLIVSGAKFLRAPRTGEDGRKITYQPVSNQAAPLPDPSIMLGYGWKQYGLTVAYGLYAPYAMNVKYPDTGAQRYALVDLTGSLFLINHLAVGWAPHPRVRIGVGFQAYTAIIRMMIAASAYIGVFGAPEDRDLDLYTETKGVAPFAPTGNVGAWGRLLDLPQVKLDLGASVQFPALLDATGKIKVRLPTHALFDSTSISGDQIKTTLKFPMVLRAGLRATFLQRVDIEVAFVWEGWSIFDQVSIQPKGSIILKDVPTIGDYKIPPLSVPHHFRNTFSVRIGGSVQILPKRFSVRLGYAYERGAIPDETFSVFLLDSDKHLLGLGTSIQVGRHIFDLSYGLYIQQTKEISTSRFKQINPLNPEGASVIGNGRYESMVHIVGVGWRGSF